MEKSSGEVVVAVSGAIAFTTNVFFVFQAEDGIRDGTVTGVQTCALPISGRRAGGVGASHPWTGREAARPPPDPEAARAARSRPRRERRAGRSRPRPLLWFRHDRRRGGPGRLPLPRPRAQ